MSIDQESSDRPKEACGIFGIHNHPEAARLTYFGTLRPAASGAGECRHRRCPG